MQFLKPPQFADSSRQQQARLNHILIMTMVVGLIIYSVATLVFVPAQNSRILFAVVLFLFTLISNVLNQKGYVAYASWLFIFGLFSVVVLGASTNGGIRAPGYPASLIVILLTGVLLNIRAAIVMAFICIIWGGLLIFGMPRSVITDDSQTVAIYLIVSICYFFVIALIYYATDNINQALKRAELELAERERAENALHKSEAKYRRLLEEVWDVVYTISVDGRILSLNSSFEDLTGYPVEQWIDQPLLPLFVETDQQAVITRISKIATGTASFPPTEYKVKTKSGEVIIVEFASSLIDEGERTVIMGIARDVTEKRRVEEALQQTQKLDSLGMMAGGIAHDFNNLLVGMLAQTSLAERLLPEDSPAQKPIHKAVQAAERASDLTRQLLAYSGRGNFEIRPLNMNQLIQQNLHIFEIAIPKQVTVITDFYEPLPFIEADKGQIQQIVMNLIINAAQAIGKQTGKITIGTQICKLESSDTTFTQYTGQSLPAGSYVQFSVSDEGKGMDEETLRQIFDPFYSTKVEGYGLGLAAVLGIVRAHRGGICVKSKRGQGTVFKLVFPIIKPRLEMEESLMITEETEVRNDKAVLIIDDEASVRDAIEDILAMDEIKTFKAVDGQQGIDLFVDHQAQIGLILLDLSMPGLSGIQTLQLLREESEEITIILTSGYSQPELIPSHKLADGYLSKPYDIQKLLQVVRTYL